MELSDILTPGSVVCGVEVGSKKRILEKAGAIVAELDPSLTQEEVVDSLLARERLGSTGLGHGVAIPHGRLKHLARTVGAFIRMQQPVDFDAVDNIPVDVLFVLLVPEESTDEHLEVLSKLAEMFSDEDLLDKIRSQRNCADTYQLITHWAPQ